MPRTRKLQVVGRALKPGCQVRSMQISDVEYVPAKGRYEMGDAAGAWPCLPEDYRDTLEACVQFVDAGQYGACAEFLRHTPFVKGSHRALEIVMANSPPGSAGEAVRMALGETFR